MASDQISIARPNVKSSAAVQIIDLTSDNDSDTVGVIASSRVEETRIAKDSGPEESDGDGDEVVDGDVHAKEDEDEDEDEEEQPWESESLYADALDAMGDNNQSANPCKWWSKRLTFIAYGRDSF